MLEIRSRRTLGGGDFGWLKALHHFNVTPDGNRAHGPMGSLVVWNDDEVAPGTGFGMHGHADMEIVTYVREGEVSHRDSAGHAGRVQAGDVQAISAGTGIRHSEQNDGAVPLKLFQIWLQPRERGGEPRYGARAFPKGDRSGQLVVLASGDPEDADALPIRADGRILGATLSKGDLVEHDLAPGRHAYLTAAYGVMIVNGCRIEEGDGVAVTGERKVIIRAETAVELVLVDAGPAPVIPA